MTPHEFRNLKSGDHIIENSTGEICVVTKEFNSSDHSVTAIIKTNPEHYLWVSNPDAISKVMPSPEEKLAADIQSIKDSLVRIEHKLSTTP